MGISQLTRVAQREYSEDPFLVRREGNGIAFAKADRRGAVRLADKNCAQAASALSAFVKNDLLAIGRKGDQHGAVEPGELSLGSVGESVKNIFRSRSSIAMTAVPSVETSCKRQVAWSRSQKTEVSGHTYGHEAPGDGGGRRVSGEPYFVVLWRPCEPVQTGEISEGFHVGRPSEL